jgi:hypothetical protein
LLVKKTIMRYPTHIVVFVSGCCHHCHPAVSSATTAAGVSNAPWLLLPLLMWYLFPCCRNTLLNWSHHGHDLLKKLKGLF